MKSDSQRQIVRHYRKILEVFSPSHNKFPEGLVFKIHDWAESHEDLEFMNTDPDYLERIWHALRNGHLSELVLCFLRTLAAHITALEKDESRAMRHTFRTTFGMRTERLRTKFAI